MSGCTACGETDADMIAGCPAAACPHKQKLMPVHNYDTLGRAFDVVAPQPDFHFVPDPFPQDDGITDTDLAVEMRQGLGLKPVNAPLLPTDSKTRKEMPIYRGVVAYFPRALGAIAHLSFQSNEKHNPGEPLHWSKNKSSDHLDCIMRHLIENGTVDPDDGFLHDIKLAWRALANLEIVLENHEQEQQ